ncbi:ABC transporter substrate-binding protein [Tabrizicola sp.]|uniref:ABC transporter substrate-binding protein n=1 Tax=Tabrizicola sp. TaxID=2005166 RepID=UPI003F325BCE
MKMTTTRRLLALTTIITGLAAPAFADAEWAAANGFGPDAGPQDWAAIEAAAKEEGEVIIYSVSSRVAALGEAFEAKYGIKVVPHDISSDVQMEKFRREHRAGMQSVDVLYNNETPVMLEEFMPQEMVWNFVPDGLEGVLAPEEMSPFLVHRWSSRILAYNAAEHPEGVPFDNLWDLTKEEWKGRVQTPDPLGSAVQTSVYQSILANPDAMAAAYEKEFGEPLVISEAVVEAVGELPTIDAPNAAHEWFYRFLQNEPVYISSTNKIFENVGQVGQTGAPVGFVTFSKLRDVEPGKIEAAPAYGVEPAMGLAYPTVIVVADNAPNPNAAKLLIRFMMEAEGFAPWNVIGDYAARSDLETAQLAEFGMPALAEASLMMMDPVEVHASKYTFLQLFLSLK